MANKDSETETVEADAQTNLQCYPFILGENETAVIQSDRSIQTEVIINPIEKNCTIYPRLTSPIDNERMYTNNVGIFIIPKHYEKQKSIKFKLPTEFHEHEYSHASDDDESMLVKLVEIIMDRVLDNVFNHEQAKQEAEIEEEKSKIEERFTDSDNTKKETDINVTEINRSENDQTGQNTKSEEEKFNRSSIDENAKESSSSRIPLKKVKKKSKERLNLDKDKSKKDDSKTKIQGSGQETKQEDTKET